MDEVKKAWDRAWQGLWAQLLPEGARPSSEGAVGPWRSDWAKVLGPRDTWWPGDDASWAVGARSLLSPWNQHPLWGDGEPLPSDEAWRFPWVAIARREASAGQAGSSPSALLLAALPELRPQAGPAELLGLALRLLPEEPKVLAWFAAWDVVSILHEFQQDRADWAARVGALPFAPSGSLSLALWAIAGGQDPGCERDLGPMRHFFAQALWWASGQVAHLPPPGFGPWRGALADATALAHEVAAPRAPGDFNAFPSHQEAPLP